MGDIYCAIWDVCRGTYLTRAEKSEARSRALDTIAEATMKCEGIVLELGVRK